MARPKVAFFGAGASATIHATAAARLGWTPVAVAARTTSSESARRLAGHSGARVVPIGALPAGADIVVVAGPPSTHATQATDLLDAGAAVVVDKPLCTTLADADRIVAAAERHADRLLYAENLLYAPVVQAFIGAARSAERVQHLEARALQARPGWGEYLSDGWGGGALFDLGAHPLAVVLLAAGRSPLRVTAELRGGADHPADEFADVRLDFGDGLTGRVVASWQAGPEPIWDAQASWAAGVVRAEILPTPALERNGEPIGFSGTTGAFAALDDLGYSGQLSAFHHDLRAGLAPVSSARFGRQVLEVTMASYRSAGLGRSVELPFTGDRTARPLDQWRLSSR